MEDSTKRVSLWTVASMLERMGFEAKTAAERAGQQVDVLAATPSGNLLAIALKQWRRPEKTLITKAVREATLLLQSAKVELAWIVIPTLSPGAQRDCVYNLDGFRTAAMNLINSEPDFGFRGKRGKLGESLSKESGKRIFVAMPFAEQFDDTYHVGIVPAAQEVGAVCVRVDESYLSKPIVETILSEIGRADLVIADLTNANPNVTYELGYAHALDKPAIHIAATEPEVLPFDLRQWPTLKYKFGQVHRLAAELMVRISEAFDDDCERDG